MWERVPAWAKRQYVAAQATRSGLVYTPQVLLQGRDFREWQAQRKFAAAVSAASRLPARAHIALMVTPQEGSVSVRAEARVPGSADRSGAALFVALADSGLVSEVKAGENAGRRLTHDHVVRAMRGDIRVDAQGDGAAIVVLPLPPEPGAGPTIVAFVQNVASGEVLQTVSLPLAAACTGPR